MGLYFFLQKMNRFPGFPQTQATKKPDADLVHCRLLKATISNRSFEYFELFPDGNRLGPALHPQLGINVTDMALHSGEGNE